LSFHSVPLLEAVRCLDLAHPHPDDHDLVRSLDHPRAVAQDPALLLPAEIDAVQQLLLPLVLHPDELDDTPAHLQQKEHPNLAEDDTLLRLQQKNVEKRREVINETRGGGILLLLMLDDLDRGVREVRRHRRGMGRGGIIRGVGAEVEALVHLPPRRGKLRIECRRVGGRKRIKTRRKL